MAMDIDRADFGISGLDPMAGGARLRGVMGAFEQHDVSSNLF
jgi:hypothetical protein